MVQGWGGCESGGGEGVGMGEGVPGGGLVEVVPCRCGSPLCRSCAWIYGMKKSEGLIRDCERLGVKSLSMITVTRDPSRFPDPDHVINRGSLCSKGAALSQLVENTNRITEPMYRAPHAKEWKKVSWDWALKEIAKRVKLTKIVSTGPDFFIVLSKQDFCPTKGVFKPLVENPGEHDRKEFVSQEIEGSHSFFFHGIDETASIDKFS